MEKKYFILYVVILIFVVLFLWQWLSKGALINQVNALQKYNNQLQVLSGIGPLKSAHLHADVKVYINGKAIDFSQTKYQLVSNYIHFEDGIGDVVHTHAAGLTIGHLFKSLEIDFNNNCIIFDEKSYCDENNKKLRFFVNGQANNEFDNRVIKDLDKYLVSYGDENESEIQNQIYSVTNLAAKYSLQR